RSGSAPANAVATFVGSETCAGCHQAEAQLWRGSQHRHAMDHATDTSVLGDFNDASFDHDGVQSRFVRKDGKFLVETDGPDGSLAPFEIKYTFGVDPLQQYLVEFPDGRLQALSLAWDSRPKEKGGQHWFHLYPNEAIRHDDALHWTKLNQNWNFMCAECHSTGVHKNYDAASDRFATTSAEISVGCEACHGQGSRHVRWARDRQSWWPFGKHEDPSMGLLVRFDERSGANWHHDPATGSPERGAAPQILRKEVETCGLCHARRGAFSEAWVPGRWLSDTHAVSGLDRGLYEADGQMRDEVYTYGSFKQSRMFAAGVTCSDCHDPHSAELRISGDATCSQCHAADRYAAATHHHHEKADPPLACASCHMPVRTYMTVDQRHDHSFRVPRPDVSVRLGTPNACTDCHANKSAEWAASAVERWYGPDRKGYQTYAEAFHAAWTDQLNAEKLLAAVAADGGTPGIARASALAELNSHASPATIDLAQAGLADRDPMVRIGALDMLDGMPAAQIWPTASPLLADPSPGVRIRVAGLLASVPVDSLPAPDRARFERAASELIASHRLNADRPESRSALGTFHAQVGRVSEAETEYKAALRLSPQYSPAAVNLADLYRGLGRDGEGEVVLRAAIVASPQDAGAHHALGLALVRLNRPDEALRELRRAAELEPDRARYAYVYAVGLHSMGRASDAITILKDSLARHPDDRDHLAALISFSRDVGDAKAALEYAERLARIVPPDPDLARLIDALRAQAN
ncbi:tetratricopeptide repeat protein, partial [Mycobacterium sp. KBS0706]|uniref:tetratricopeptide repeat protein n=1 Tax=Mycobacterium sp. KBS0706 TaxID=2578109 RepID=UPI00117E201E